MVKEITEKTFELNITSELINLSKAWIWELDERILANLLQNISIREFLSRTTLYGEGLTQKKEAELGYDVCIMSPYSSFQDGRLLILQYKSGVLRKYSKKDGSLFENGNNSTEHIMFTFNNAAGNSQHIRLREFINVNKERITPNSVMYVFPRLTTQTDFINNIGKLVSKSSFVPINEIDGQAQAANIEILEGREHKYRTSLDGTRSEINFFLLLFQYDNTFLTGLISELISVQIQRLAELLAIEQKDILVELLEMLPKYLKSFLSKKLKEEMMISHVISERILFYVYNIKKSINEGLKVPQTSSEYTTLIPKEGLFLKLPTELSRNLQYQII